VSQHITRLAVEHIMGIMAVDLVFDPKTRIVTIRGENQQGKTSLLTAIALALGGKRIQPPEVIHQGQSYARVLLETEDLIVERRWLTNTDSQLEVRSQAGAKFRRPQEMLDKLISRVSFDPLHFIRLDRDAQAETLRRLVGLDFTEIEGKHRKIFDDRTVRNRDLAGLQRRLDAIPAESAPLARVEVSQLLEQQATLTGAAQARQLAAGKVDTAKKTLADRQRLVADAEAALAAAYKRRTEAAAELASLTAAADALAPAPTPEQLAAISQQIAQASDHNTRVARQEERAKLAAEVTAVEAEVKNMTGSLEQLEAEKAIKLKEAKFPLPGLGFGSIGVTFEGLPLEQINAARKVRISTAIGFALNPELKMLRIVDGPYLDRTAMGILTELAEQHDGQIFLEAGGEEGVGVVIREGRVAAINGGVAQLYNQRADGGEA